MMPLPLPLPIMMRGLLCTASRQKASEHAPAHSAPYVPITAPSNIGVGGWRYTHIPDEGSVQEAVSDACCVEQQSSVLVGVEQYLGIAARTLELKILFVP